jgi:hypothetical protein
LALLTFTTASSRPSKLQSAKLTSSSNSRGTPPASDRCAVHDADSVGCKSGISNRPEAIGDPMIDRLLNLRSMPCDIQPRRRTHGRAPPLLLRASGAVNETGVSRMLVSPAGSLFEPIPERKRDPGRLETLGRILLPAVLDYSLEGRGSRASSLRHTGRVVMQRRTNYLAGGLSAESAPSGHHLVRKGAQREDISAKVDLRATDLLRRRVNRVSRGSVPGL